MLWSILWITFGVALCIAFGVAALRERGQRAAAVQNMGPAEEPMEDFAEQPADADFAELDENAFS